MSIQIKLHVEESVISVMSYQLSVTQGTDYTGRPSSKPVVQSIKITYETIKNDPFFEKMINGKMSDTLVFKISPIAMNGKSTTVTVKDYYIKVHHENFDGINNQPMTTYVEVTFAILIVNGVVMDVKYWKVTDPYAKNIPITTINRNEEEIIEEKKDKKCVIKFEADNNDIKNGIFGFDEIPNRYKRICKSDVDKLKDEYTPITVESEEYFVPWVSIRKGQTITLKLNKNIKQKAEYESIAFEEHPDFTITPTDLKEAKEIQITCKNTNQNTAQIKVMADGKDAGALNFFYPKPKTIDLKWYFVEITGNGKDKDDLKDKIDQTKLEALLKKGLNPALIDVTLSNTTAEIIDISEYRDRLKNKGMLKKHSDTEIGKYIEKDYVQRVFGTIGIKHTKDTDILNLYIINRKCITTTEISSSGEFPTAGGLSPTGHGLAYMVVDGNGNMLITSFIHEIMHALGLKHTFSEKDKNGKLANEGKKHLFKDKSTENYMDYDDAKEYTWKWQWEKLRNYSHLK